MPHEEAYACRVVTIDIECRPGHWISGDYVSKIITAVAWKWSDAHQVVVLDHYETSPKGMALTLAAEIQRADLVVGHFIRLFDLPLLNGELLRVGGLPLAPVSTLDTKLDLLVAHGRSKSQENLAAMLGLEAPKIHMTNDDWERFNAKDPALRFKGRDRVRCDVEQNEALRAKLASLGWLRAPTTWRPSTLWTGSYRP